MVVLYSCVEKDILTMSFKCLYEYKSRACRLA